MISATIYPVKPVLVKLFGISRSPIGGIIMVHFLVVWEPQRDLIKVWGRERRWLLGSESQKYVLHKIMQIVNEFMTMTYNKHPSDETAWEGMSLIYVHTL